MSFRKVERLNVGRVLAGIHVPPAEVDAPTDEDQELNLRIALKKA